MKSINVIFEEADCSPILPSDRLEAAAKLIENLCTDADFRRRFEEFLKTYDSEVPTVSWVPPRDT